MRFAVQDPLQLDIIYCMYISTSVSQHYVRLSPYIPALMIMDTATVVYRSTTGRSCAVRFALGKSYVLPSLSIDLFSPFFLAWFAFFPSKTEMADVMPSTTSVSDDQ